LYQVPRERHVVVREEDNAGRCAPALRANATTRWISALPPSSAGWALPERTTLERPLGVREQPRQPLGIAEEQVGALVRGEASCKADRQCVWVE